MRRRRTLSTGLTLIVFIAALVIYLLQSRGWLSVPFGTQAVLPPSGPQSLQLYVEPDDGAAPVVDAIDAAQTSVKMEMYLLSSEQVVKALKLAKNRGVDVRVLLEDSPFGGAGGVKEMFADLEHAGVAIKATNPAYKLTHQKSIVIDDRVALIMTANMSDSALNANREYIVADADPEDVAEISAVFDADWRRVEPRLSRPNLLWSPVNSRERLLALIDSAQKTLDVQVEVFSDDEVIAHVVAAAKRGVSVRLVMSPATSGTDTSASARSQIKAAGGQVRLLKRPYIHAKLIIADGTRAYVGSENFTGQSLDFNRELGILISDAKVLERLAAVFRQDFEKGQ
jgi:phosphatidylserine/phosphatidylglycerophosphate/cardiolipin synthase-like enzyme